jgi:iron-sulfur cluster assembly accessory protein
MSDLIGIGKKPKKVKISSDLDLPFQITESAALEIQDRTHKEGFTLSLMRLKIQAGGCSGLSYLFELTQEKQDSDLVFTSEIEALKDVQVLIDPKSFKVLEGCILDFHRQIGASSFKIINPKAQTTCSCGQSFAL